MKRIKKIQEKIKQKKIDAVVFFQSGKIQTKDIPYLINFWGSFGILIITQKKYFFVTDFRYINEVKKNSKIPKHNIYNLSNFKNFNQIFKKFLPKNSKKIIIADQVSHQDFTKIKKIIKKILSNVTIRYDAGFLQQWQILKNKKELKLIQDGQNHVEKILKNKLPKLIYEGITEKELAFLLEQELKKEGQFNLSFDSIVAFGKNSAIPHHKPDNTKLKNNQNILIDCGVMNKGYCTDMTRNFWFGDKINKQYLQDFNILKKIQENLSQKYLVNANISNFSKKAEIELENNFGKDGNRHSLGHGVGFIEIHQSPSINSQTKSCLKEGMVVTNEPGVYKNGKYGIRIEDLIYITKNKPLLISKFNRNLILLKNKTKK